MTTIKNKPHIQNKSKIHEVTEIRPGLFEVVSGSSGETYTVALTEHGGATCSCPWGQYRTWNAPQSGCSHSVAVYRELIKKNHRLVSVWTNQEDAERQHRPMTDIGDGVILTSRKEDKPKKSEAQILKELGF